MIERRLYDDAGRNGPRGENPNHLHNVASSVIKMSTFFIMYSACRIGTFPFQLHLSRRDSRFDRSGLIVSIRHNIAAYYSADHARHSPI